MLLPMNAGGELTQLVLIAVLSCWAFGVLVAEGSAAQASQGAGMRLSSTGFTEGGLIPEKYTCDGRNVSPPLEWTGVPSPAKSITLIVDDPDAPGGTWVHWVLYDLPPQTKDLPEDLPKSQYLPGGAKQGLNDFKHLGYGGPCPPPGKPHRYFFKLYALDALLGLRPGATKQEVERAMAKHILAEARLMGAYKRK